MQSTLSDQDTQDLAQRPVFVDPSGRRRRTLRYIALGACALFACYVIVFVAALLGAPIPRSALIPLPQAPAQPTSWQDSAPAGEPGRPDANGPASGSREPSRGAGRPDTGAPAQPGRPDQRETVAVTPTAGPTLSVERPNSKAAPTPPGLTKHTETRPGRNGR